MVTVAVLPLIKFAVLCKTQRRLDYFLHYFYFSMHKGTKSLMGWRVVYKIVKNSSNKVVFVVS